MECFLRNKYTLTGFVLICAGITFSLIGMNLVAIPCLVISYFLLKRLRFGATSYAVYERVYQHMVQYGQPVETNTYCGSIGVKVARRRLKRKFPKEYKTLLEIEKELNQPDMQFEIIEIHFRERNF